MRILFVIPYFAPAWSFGGPIKVVMELSKELLRQGHEVTVATTDVLDRKHRHNKSIDTIDGIEVHYFKNISNTLAARANVYMPRGFRAWLKKNIRKYDVVHCHDLYTWLHVAVAEIAPQSGVSFLVQPHGALNSTRVAAGKTGFKKAFLKLYPSILREASALIASTAKEKKDEIGAYDSSLLPKTFVVANGISTTQIAAPHADDAERQRLGLRPGERMLVYFGRIQHIKGIDITLRALSLLPDVQYRFFVIGRDDGVLAQLQDLAKELKIHGRIVWVGPTFGAKLAVYLANADAFLFNSRSEALPMAVLDAAAAGLPPIISPYCNLPEVAAHGAGVVLSKNTPETTAAAIRQYLTDPSAARTMRENCHRLIREHFNIASIAQTYLALYKSLTPPPTA